MKKLPSIAMYLLLSIGVLVFLICVFLVDQKDPETWKYSNPILYAGYIYFIICIVLALIGAVVGGMANPAGLKKSAIGIGAFALICIIGYVMADGTVLKSYGDVSETAVKLSDAGLYIMYILSIAAVGSIVFASISKALK